VDIDGQAFNRPPLSKGEDILEFGENAMYFPYVLMTILSSTSLE